MAINIELENETYKYPVRLDRPIWGEDMPAWAKALTDKSTRTGNVISQEREKINEISSLIQNLEASISGNESSISLNSDDIKTITESLDSIEDSLDTIESRIGSIDSKTVNASESQAGLIERYINETTEPTPISSDSSGTGIGRYILINDIALGNEHYNLSSIGTEIECPIKPASNMFQFDDDAYGIQFLRKFDPKQGPLGPNSVEIVLITYFNDPQLRSEGTQEFPSNFSINYRYATKPMRT